MKYLKNYTNYILFESTSSELTAEEKSAFSKFRVAVSNISMKAPYLYKVLDKLKIRSSYTISTMCVDGITLMYNPKFVLSLDNTTIVYIIIHELLHVIFDHCTIYRQNYGKVRDDKIWNYACDYSINLVVPESINNYPAFEMYKREKRAPAGGLYNEKFIDMSAYEIYDIIEETTEKEQSKPKKGGKQTCPDCGGSGQISPKQEQNKEKEEQNKDNQNQEGQGDKKEDHGTEQDGKGHEHKEGEICPHCGGTGEVVEEGSSVDDAKNIGGVAKPGSLRGGKDVYEETRKLDKTDIGKGDPELEKRLKEQGENSIGDYWKENIAKLMGSMPAGIRRALKINKAGRVDWVSVFMDVFEKKMKKDNVRYKPGSRRHAHRMVAKTNKIVPFGRHEIKDEYVSGMVVFDTSGSITDDEIGKFAAELKTISENFNIEYLYVVFCDADINNLQVFVSDDATYSGSIDDVDSIDNFYCKLKPKGGGGTSFIPPFQWKADEEDLHDGLENVDFVIYFTDAYGTMPPNHLMVDIDNMFWVVVTKSDNEYAKLLPIMNDGAKIFIDPSGKDVEVEEA
jgi:predicted metal-dependent peptidase